MNDLVIYECGLKDIEKVKDICEQTFYETFEQENSKEDMESYLQEQFSYEQLEREVAHPSSIFLAVKDEEDIVAYMKVNFADAQTEEGYDHTLEIQRIYVLKAYKGRGIGRMLMECAIQVARNNHLEAVWLGVWEHNYPALQFYKRYGFERFSEHIFKLGEDEQIDYLMRLVL